MNLCRVSFVLCLGAGGVFCGNLINLKDFERKSFFLFFLLLPLHNSFVSRARGVSEERSVYHCRVVVNEHVLYL